MEPNCARVFSGAGKKKGDMEKGVHNKDLVFVALFIKLYPCEVIYTFVQGLSITFWDF